VITEAGYGECGSQCEKHSNLIGEDKELRLTAFFIVNRQTAVCSGAVLTNDHVKVDEQRTMKTPKPSAGFTLGLMVLRHLAQADMVLNAWHAFNRNG
jgi:hypothetical protein